MDAMNRLVFRVSKLATFNVFARDISMSILQKLHQDKKRKRPSMRLYNFYRLMEYTKILSKRAVTASSRLTKLIEFEVEALSPNLYPI